MKTTLLLVLLTTSLVAGAAEKKNLSAKYPACIAGDIYASCII